MLRGIVDRFARAYERGFVVVLKLSSFALQFRQVADAHCQLGSQVIGNFPLYAKEVVNVEVDIRSLS